MPYEIKILDILDIELESSFLVLARNMGVVTKVKTWSYLILGGSDPIVVDTGRIEPGDHVDARHDRDPDRGDDARDPAREARRRRWTTSAGSSTPITTSTTLARTTASRKRP